MTDPATRIEPTPTQSEKSQPVLPEIADLFEEMAQQGGISDEAAKAAIEVVAKRTEFGVRKYGQELYTHDGRDSLVDALQEAADLVQYLQKAWLETERVEVDSSIESEEQLPEEAKRLMKLGALSGVAVMLLVEITALVGDRDANHDADAAVDGRTSNTSIVD